MLLFYCHVSNLYHLLQYFKIIILFILSINMVKRSASSVWEYFTMFQDRLEIAKCNICSQKIRRGPPGATSKKFSTKPYGVSKIKTQRRTFISRKGAVKRNRKNDKILKKQEGKS